MLSSSLTNLSKDLSGVVKAVGGLNLVSAYLPAKVSLAKVQFTV